jgi:class 3 adenylate cyclase
VEVPEVFFADAGGVSIAWQQFGSGPDVIAIPGLITNIELNWEHEFYRRFFEYIARHVRITVFDKRGIGLSDKFHEAPTLEQRTSDILAVMDAAGLDRPSVVGASEGGLMAQLFAAQHPERVDRLVLLNTHPGRSGMLAVHRDPDGSLDRLKRLGDLFDRIVATWGRDPQFTVDQFCPSNADNAPFVRWYGRLERQSASQADIRRQIDSIGRLDAAPFLAEITAPTLVVHATGDPLMPVAGGRYVAERIPDARFVEVPGGDHFVEPTPNWQEFTDTWLEFVTGSPPLHQTERRVMTVIFTDIADSTVQTAAVGDGQWRRLLDGHDRLAWQIIDRHCGTIVKSTGDGVLARFDAPSHALGFAVDFRCALAELGLLIRCGLHTGEVEIRENGDIVGTAVNLAARVEHAADGGTILVSSTVRDLLLGGSTQFSDQGEHRLQGFDEPWRLFALKE